MKKIFIPIILILTVFSVGCDKIDNPIENSNNNGNNDTTTILKRRILIEEFTGQLCVFCPDGAREIQRLIDDVYGDQIVPVSIHAGAFADPNNGAWNDFRTPAGNDLATTFSVTGNPAAVLSRINNATVYTTPAQWESIFLPFKDDEPYAEITITNTYNASTREVAIQVDTEWLKDGVNGVNYNLQVFVIEDHIIAPQKDGTITNMTYDHRHVLRGAVNSSWGTIINTTTLGTTDTQNFNYTLDPSWNEANCEIVAFVYKAGPDYEVMQANVASVQ